jgi:hypothetical protein
MSWLLEGNSNFYAQLDLVLNDTTALASSNLSSNVSLRDIHLSLIKKCQPHELVSQQIYKNSNLLNWQASSAKFNCYSNDVRELCNSFWNHLKKIQKKDVAEALNIDPTFEQFWEYLTLAGCDESKTKGIDILKDLQKEISKKLVEPLAAPSIYVYTVSGKDDCERIVYIGLTTDMKTRHIKGHSASSKLLDPQYDGFSKHVYIYSISVPVLEFEYPIEVLSCPASRQTQLDSVALLNCVESVLIDYYQPELNIAKSDGVKGHDNLIKRMEHIHSFGGILDGSVCLNPDEQVEESDVFSGSLAEEESDVEGGVRCRN